MLAGHIFVGGNISYIFKKLIILAYACLMAFQLPWLTLIPLFDIRCLSREEENCSEIRYIKVIK
jgi:hypothetical protein